MDLKFKEIPVPEELDRVVKDSMKKNQGTAESKEDKKNSGRVWDGGGRFRVRNYLFRGESGGGGEASGDRTHF